MASLTLQYICIYGINIPKTYSLIRNKKKKLHLGLRPSCRDLRRTGTPSVTSTREDSISSSIFKSDVTLTSSSTNDVEICSIFNNARFGCQNRTNLNIVIRE